MFKGGNSAKIKSELQKVLIGKQILWERKQHDAFLTVRLQSAMSLSRLRLVVMLQINVLF